MPPPSAPPFRVPSSATFKSPPLDGSLFLPELCDWHGRNSPDHELFVYATEDGTVNGIKWSEASRAIQRGTQLIRERVGQGAQATGERTIVAILSSSDSIPYATSILSIMRARFVAFPISTRNSPAALAHLIEKTGVSHVLVGREQSMQDLIQQSLEALSRQYGCTPVVRVSPMLTFEELYSDGELNVPEDVPDQQHSPDTASLILHSSGSTAFPKPITFTLKRMLQIARAPCFGDRNLAGQVMSLHGNPMYHALGFVLTTFAITSGVCIALPAPKHPPPILTAELAIHGAMATRANILLAVPSMIESWSRNSDYIEWPSQCACVMFSGGPLDKGVGDYLASRGVPLSIEYGLTECGALSNFLPDEIIGVDWEYFSFPKHLNIKLKFSGTGQYDCVVLENEYLRPNAVNTTIDGIDGFATSDVLEEHPSKRGYWRILGRADDQIMHSTGEKTNPGPLESMMSQDLHVAAAVVFGRGRLQAGILVEPTPECAFHPVDEVKLAEFRNALWPTAQRLNAYAPQHSRIFKEMILVAKPTKPFSYTAKGTVRRGVVLEAYRDEIDALYSAVEASTQVNTPPPRQWRNYEATQFVRSCVTEIIGRKVPDDADIFQHGCDSLQATYIRNALLRAIYKSSKANISAIPETFVYENPTISRLGSLISAFVLGTKTNSYGQRATESHTSRFDAMHALVAKYTTEFPQFHSNKTPDLPYTGDVVLVTGTTGSLGCHILVQLMSNPEIRRVYALNRPPKDGKTIRQRQENALHTRGLETAMLNQDRLVLLECNLREPMFGLPGMIYNDMHASVTHIIHNAWPVDFAITLHSFEPLIQGARALIDFALTTPTRSEPPSIQYISSIGVVQNVPPGMPCTEKPTGAEGVAPTGYAESKWVSEEILYCAAAQTPLHVVVVRLGQVCGGTDGAWNSREWFPSMVQSAPVLGCFPDDTRDVDWIPADIAAAAIVDFRKCSGSMRTFHLVHPHPVSWRSLATFVSGKFSVPLVSYSDWLAKLEEYNSQYELRIAAAASPGDMPDDLHALRLMSFYRGVADRVSSGEFALGMAHLEMKEALKVSPTLADPELKRLQMQDAQMWLAYWQKMGMFS